MMATLRGIVSSEREPGQPPEYSGEEKEQLLSDALFDVLVRSEHCLFDLNLGNQEIARSAKFEVPEGKTAVGSVKDFMRNVVLRHMYAVELESALSAHYREQGTTEPAVGTDASTPEPVDDILIRSEEDIRQLLLMNRAMALGTTCTFLEGLVDHDRDLALSPMPCAPDPSGEEAGRPCGVKDPTNFLRQSHWALRTALLATPEHSLPSTQRDVAEPAATQRSAVASQPANTLSVLSQRRLSQGSFKRQRQDDDNENDSSTVSTYRRNPAFIVRAAKCASKARGQDDQSVECTFTSSCPTVVTDYTRPPEEPRSQRSVMAQSQASNVSSHFYTQATRGLSPSVMDEHIGSQSSLYAGPTRFSGNPRRANTTSGTGESNESIRLSRSATHRYDFRSGNRNIYGGKAEREDEDAEVAAGSATGAGGFVTAGEQLAIDIRARRAAPPSFLTQRRTPALGLRRTGFTPPFQQHPAQPGEKGGQNSAGGMSSMSGVPNSVAKNYRNSPEPRRKPHARASSSDDERNDFPSSLLLPDGSIPPILQSLDARLVKQVASEIVECSGGGGGVRWSSIAGLEHAKRSVDEAIVWPLLKPELFVGLRGPPRGLLLFGPPGTGKTMIARAIANRAQCTFFNISASSVMSKWMGDGEKLVRCLFAVAVVKQPSVIFIDEIDSLLSMRSDGEMDAVRRVKTEFLVQLDGVATNQGDRVLLIGATNRPDELDEAARRRMQKRLYIPLPDVNSRAQLIKMLLNESDNKCEQQGPSGMESTAATPLSVSAMDEDSIMDVAVATEGYSCSDIKQLCSEAAMYAVRELKGKLRDVEVGKLRPIERKDFMKALRRSRPSVGPDEIHRYVEWNKQFGSFPTEDMGEDEGDDEGEDDESDDAVR